MYTLFLGGYNARHPKTFLMLRQNGHSSYVLLIVKSPAQFQIGQDCFTVDTNSAVLIRPNVPYHYSGLDSEYVNDWLHFTCTDTELEQHFGQLFHKPIPLSNCMQFTQYIQNILWEHHYASEEFRPQNVSLLFQILLNKLLQELTYPPGKEDFHPYAAKLQELRLTMQSQYYRNFTPEELAQMLNISPSHFQYLYKTFFGIPFKKDLIQMRLREAQNLLQNTDLKLEQIALMCGYSNEIHFYRQFKAKTGLTPGEYRIQKLFH